MIRTSACWISRSSSLGSAFSLVLANLRLQPRNTLAELLQLQFEDRDLRLVAPPLGVCEVSLDLPVPAQQRLSPYPPHHVLDGLVAHRGRGDRPGTSNQVLLLGGKLAQLTAKTIEPTSFERLHHAQVRCPVVLREVRRIEDTENPSDCLRAHGQHLQQVTDTLRNFL